MRLHQVGGNFAPGARLRAGQFKRQAGQQGVGQLSAGHQLRRDTRTPRGIGAAQTELLGQQFVKLHAAPSGMFTRFKFGQFHASWRRMQQTHSRRKLRQME